MFEVQLAIMVGEVYLQVYTREVEEIEPKVAELREGVRLCKLLEQWLEPFVTKSAETHLSIEAVHRHEHGRKPPSG